MNLANYINDLLYRYECVIIPGFGGFITNRVGAKIDENLDVFFPPSKQIAFNSHLKANDGLLANYIAKSENISFEKASSNIDFTVNEWKNQMQTSPLQIATVGILSLNDKGQVIFEPTTKVNYLQDSFGLTNVESSSIKRYKEEVKTFIPITENSSKKGIPLFIKYAATAAILLTLSFVGNNVYQENKHQKVLASQEKALEKKIQAATFIISNPLPTIELKVAKKVTKPYHVVAGAFQFPENAKKKVNQLKKQGYNASILGVNKWGLTEVAFDSFADRSEAINNLYKIQDSVSEDAWLLVKK